MNSKITMLSILLICAVCAVESSIGKPLHITHLNCSTACPPGGRVICAISKSGVYGTFENDCFFSRYNNCVHIKETKDSEYLIYSDSSSKIFKRIKFIINIYLKLIFFFLEYEFVRYGKC